MLRSHACTHQLHPRAAATSIVFSPSSIRTIYLWFQSKKKKWSRTRNWCSISSVRVKPFTSLAHQMLMKATDERWKSRVWRYFELDTLLVCLRWQKAQRVCNRAPRDRLSRLGASSCFARFPLCSSPLLCAHRGTSRVGLWLLCSRRQKKLTRATCDTLRAVVVLLKLSRKRSNSHGKHGFKAVELWRLESGLLIFIFFIWTF